MVAGDILIDDKPYEFLSPGGKHTTATWKVSNTNNKCKETD